MTRGKVRDKRRASSPFLGRKREVSEEELSLQKWWIFKERMCNLSLGFWVFGSSDRFGPRSKVVLRIEDYTWALVSGVFDKLREVGVLSYLVYPFV